MLRKIYEIFNVNQKAEVAVFQSHITAAKVAYFGLFPIFPMFNTTKLTSLGFVWRWPSTDMECHGDFLRRSLVKYLDEVETKLGRNRDEIGTKFDDCFTKFVENSTRYNPEVIKYRPVITKYTTRRREAPPSGVFARLWSIFDHFGIVFRKKNRLKSYRNAQTS